MLVVDASVVAPLIADGGPDGELFRAAARGQTLAAPELLRVEVHDLDRKAGKELVHGFDGASATTRRAHEALGERRRGHGHPISRADGPSEGFGGRFMVGVGGVQ